MHFHMGREDLTERVPVMIFGTLAVDLAGCRIQKSEQIGGTIAPIVKVLKSRLISGWGQVGRETFERLNACTFVQTVEVLQWMGIVFNDMFHLWEKIRIGNLQVVFSAVGT
jgi:signal-transduction protein with cAMP-binding, CBS, and nucleotidyltransferase domain